MLKLKTWLETTGLKVAEERFLNPPALPYIVFTESRGISGGDIKNCIADRTISIEFYSTKIDYENEQKIENLLNERFIEYKSDRTWIETEKFFQTVYDFNLIQKF